MAIELKLPDVGDNIEKGNVVSVLVKAGDQIEEGQAILELETDKAVVEVPASASGTVESVNVKEGDSVSVGGVLVTLAGEGAAPAETAVTETASAQSSEPAQSSTTTVTLPDVGDNIEQGNVVAILVKVGDQVAKDQAIIEIETDKAVVEVPSSAAGKVESIEAKEGEALKVGGSILTLSGAVANASAAAPSTPVTQAEAPKTAAVAAPVSAPQPSSPSTATSTGEFDGRQLIHAAPSVRRLARELGVDLQSVQGSGLAGRISADDVKLVASGGSPAAAQAVAHSPQPIAHSPLPDFDKWGETRREDMSGIRRATVRSMTQAWTSIPMVTHFDKADVTLMEETRKRFGERVQKAGGKLTLTHILMKVVANALRKFPKFNASLDVANEQVVFKDYVNVGVAVDTPVGLLVPVLKDADRKSITDMVLELGELAERARERKLKPDEMQGATFTISNLGGIGGHAFTPIVNSPEVAILGVSRGGFEPVWNKEKGEFEPRNMLPLAVTYDHRLIDGADAARFLRFVCESLEDPFLISL